MASNEQTLADGDGVFSDWIEIYNPGNAPVSLAGWYLSDNLGNLRKWRFPAGSEIAAKRYLVIFASDRVDDGGAYTDPAGHLHTNFRLARDGEDLVLVMPDGLSIAHAYVNYPAQQSDISYGLPQQSMTLVGEAAETAYRVPAAGDAGDSWTDAGYDDSLWGRGLTGIGFDRGGGVTEGLIAHWPLDEGAGEIVYDATGRYDGILVGRRRPTWDLGPGGTGQALQFFGETDSHVDLGALEINIGAEFTLTCWANAPLAALGQYRVILAKGPKNAGHFELYLNATTGGGRTAGDAAMYVPELGDFWSGYVVPDGNWHHLAWTYDGGIVSLYTDGRLFKTFSASGRVSAKKESFKIGSLADGGFPFLGVLSDIRIYDRPLTPAQVHSLTGGPMGDLKTDVSEEMLNMNSTVWMRTSFALSDPIDHDFLLLRVKYTDGFIAYLNGVEVARDNAPLVTTWCSSSLAAGSQASSELFQDFDLSSHIHLLRTGRNVLAIHGLNDSADDRRFLVLPMLIAGTDPSPSRETCYFTCPTPGQPNATGYAGISESPQFSRASGTFTSPFSLALTAPSPHAKIFYTLDGSEPTELAQLCTGVITVDRTLEVRARAYEPGHIPSPIAGHLFLAIDTDMSAFASNLPLVLIDTRGNAIPGTSSSSYGEALSLFIDTDWSGRATVAGEVQFAGHVGMRIRGRSSTQFPKKQYKMETWDDKQQDRDVELFGLPSESDWVLHGPYSDKTLIRNYLAYLWWGRLGHYSVRTRFCEVFLNDDKAPRMSYADDYVGVYLLIESIKIAANRLDLAKLTAQDDREPGITGGYVLEMGNANPGGFSSTLSGQRVEFSFWDPKVDQLASLQKQWIQNYIRSFETALYSPQFADPVTGYAAYTDIASQVDYEIMREITRNFDGGSTFFYVDRDGKLTMGPLWDYNMAMGNVNYAHDDIPGYHTTGWNNSYMAAGVNGWSPWWRRLGQDPVYRRRFAQRWFELRRGPLSDATIMTDIDAVTALLNEAASRNFRRWNILGQHVWANPPGWEFRTTYQSEVDWLKRWLLDRTAWIDSQLVGMTTDLSE